MKKFMEQIEEPEYRLFNPIWTKNDEKKLILRLILLSPILFFMFIGSKIKEFFGGSEDQESQEKEND